MVANQGFDRAGEGGASAGGTMTQFSPSVANWRTPPESVVMTGQPTAIDSSAGRPNPSPRDEKTNRSQRA